MAMTAATDILTWKALCLGLAQDRARLESEAADLRGTVGALKQLVDTLMIELSEYHISADKEKWIYYHLHKNNVKGQMSEADLRKPNAWRKIKALTDKMMTAVHTAEGLSAPP